jgi:hypothetical protein
MVFTPLADNDAIIDLICENREIASILISIAKKSFNSNDKESSTECIILISQLLSGGRSNFGPPLMESKILDLLYDLKDWNDVPATREKLLITHNLLLSGPDWAKDVLKDTDLVTFVLESLSHSKFSVRKCALELMIEIVM